MPPESPQTPSIAMLQYLRKHKSEAQEILRLIELFKSSWEERRKDASIASQDAQIIQILRHRLSELAQEARAELEKSLLKFEQLRREIEQQKEKRLALFGDKMPSFTEGIKTLDRLLAPATKTTTKASATKATAGAATPTTAKYEASAQAKAASGTLKKPGAPAAQAGKAAKGSTGKSRGSKAKASSKSATKSVAKSSDPAEATPAQSATKNQKTSEI